MDVLLFWTHITNLCETGYVVYNFFNTIVRLKQRVIKVCLRKYDINSFICKIFPITLYEYCLRLI